MTRQTSRRGSATAVRFRGTSLAHLFDAFVQSTPDTRRDGLGLGLYIVQQVAHGHGGTVAAESKNDHTTIAVRLPRRLRESTARP
jgi:signal transduction histidine kinase